MMFLKLLFFSFLTITNVAAVPHQYPGSAITRRLPVSSDMTEPFPLVGGVLDGNGNGNGDSGNNDTNGENGNNNGHNGNGNLSGNTIVLRATDATSLLTGVLDGNGNGGGDNGNGDINGENGDHNGDNGDGNLSGNVIDLESGGMTWTT